MNNLVTKVTSLIPTIIRNTHLNITLQGWPATFSNASVCATFFGIHALEANGSQSYADNVVTISDNPTPSSSNTQQTAQTQQ